MAAFRPRSGTYPEESSFGGAGSGGDAGSVTSHHSVNGRNAYGYESSVAEANASRGTSARAPPKLDIALATAMTTPGTGMHPAAQTSAGASKSGSLSSTTGSKLGPLTPSLSIHTRDPEDERVLDLLSRSTPSTAVAVGTGGAPTTNTTATGIPSSGSASGSVHGGSVRAGSVGSVVNLANGKRSSFDGEMAALVASIGGD
ncbi:hypothetical protein FRC17_000255 [Serendipita sp. 399]|nr:hypothetical protein FRC17_000255 [Serendipita sp. 399]